MPVLGVLHIDTMKSWRGGERQACYLAEGLARNGCRVAFACQPGSDISRRLENSDVMLHPTVFRFEADFSAAWRIAGLVRKYKYDILHMHDSHAHWLGGCASIISGRPLRVVSRRVDFSIHRHGYGLSIVKYRYFADAFVAVSEAVRAALVRDGVPENMIHVIHSGARTQRRALGTERKELNGLLGLNGSTKLIGTVGSLVGHKGHKYFVEAARKTIERLPEARFVILGEGRLRKDLEREIGQSGLAGRFFLPGHVREASRLLRGFDLFVMPSVMEGLGTSVLDAMDAGVPVISTSAGGLKEIVRDNETGLVVEPASPDSLAAAMEKLMSDERFARRLKLKARRMVAEEFSVDGMVQKTCALYDKLISGRA